MKVRNSLLMFAVSCAALTASGVCATTIDETKLTPSDGAANDYFGISVAITGTTAIVGSMLDDDSGADSGSAYLFDAATGAHIAKLTANDGAAADHFGSSVSISGTTAIVGAYGNDDNGTYSGSAYLFDTATGVQFAKLTANDGAAGDLFGNSVAISGTTAIVGAEGDDDNGINSGSAYLFDSMTGAQIAKLTASDGAELDSFGVSVAISGTTAIVGAFKDDGNGSAYLFDTVTGAQIAKLTANDGAAGDYFGYSVAISGTTAIVGASMDDVQGTDSGSAYLFDTVTGAQIGKLTANDGAANDHFGVSVAISGTTAVVGAHANDENGADSGSAYFFDLLTGAQIAKLTGVTEYDNFGLSVAIFGTEAIVGAHRNVGLNDSGAAYLYNFAEPLPAVPLPAGVWLLSAALGGLSVLRRGRRA